VDAETDRTIRSPVGFCTVYKFFLYPNSTRPRISQFFILPTHQRRGIGSKLYSAVYNYLKDLPESRDITGEPSNVPELFLNAVSSGRTNSSVSKNPRLLRQRPHPRGFKKGKNQRHRAQSEADRRVFEATQDQ
jgi:GNAT superfamily N-acetyltransferase